MVKCMDGWTKLFKSITRSSMWHNEHTTRIVWVTMLALCDLNGFVAGTVLQLADESKVTEEEAEKALQVFLNPDPNSGTAAFDGRRIEEMVLEDGTKGWILLNHAKYAKKMSRDQLQEMWARQKAAQRAKAKSPKLAKVREQDESLNGNGPGKSIEQWTKDASGDLPKKRREEAQEMVRRFDRQKAEEIEAEEAAGAAIRLGEDVEVMMAEERERDRAAFAVEQKRTI